MDLRHFTRLTAAMAYAYLNVNSRVERYVGSDLYDMNISLLEESPIEMTISGIEHRGNQLKSTRKGDKAVEKAVEIMLFINEVTGRITDGNYIKHPERTLAQTIATFDREHGYASFSKNMRNSIQYVNSSPYSLVEIDDEIIGNYLRRKEGFAENAMDLRMNFMPFGSVVKHFVFNNAVREAVIDRSSEAYKRLKAAVDRMDPGIPNLDHEEFVCFMIFATNMIRVGHREGRVFLPTLNADALMFGDGVDNTLKLMIIEPCSCLDIIVGEMKEREISEDSYEIKLGTIDMNVKRISTSSRLNASELRILGSRYREQIEGSTVVVIRGCLDIGEDELKDIMKGCSRISVIDAVQACSLPTILFPSMIKLEELASVSFDIPERDLARGLVGKVSFTSNQKVMVDENEESLYNM